MARNGQRFRGLLVGACAAISLFVAPAPAPAQDSPPAQGSFQAPSSPDFMLGRPRASIGVNGQWIFASAGSDLYEFVTDQLTLEKSSFNTPAFGANFGVNVLPRLDLTFGLEYSKSSTPSEYRDFVDNDLLPIQQTTALRHLNLAGSAKFAVLPPGRAVSRLAWIPSAVVPYVGAGAGVSNYKFEQFGDFVDFNDSRVFSDAFQSSGWAPTVHVFGGTDIQMYKRMFLSLEGRYMWGSAELDRDFIDFEPIDLGGFRFGAGIHVVF
jgi:opacity protein-like surface antigen